jgi:hypothetical protein
MTLTRLAATVIATCFTASAFAGSTFTATLSGAQEVPVRVTPATGSGTVDLTGNLLTVSLSFSGLTTPNGAAHIHCCSAVGVNAAVAIDFVDAGGFPVGTTSGTYSKVFDLGLISTYTTGFVTANGGTLASARAAFITGLFGGRTYFNIHTTQFPGGEIRGQIPEPATVALLGLGLAGLGIARRRKA